MAIVSTIALVRSWCVLCYKFFTPDYLEDFEDDEFFEFDEEECNLP